MLRFRLQENSDKLQLGDVAAMPEGYASTQPTL
jgi:hypothetical protein